MSEKEKKSGAGAESSLVLVEKSTASRHKQPFRPTDMQEDAPPDLHKRSKAPAVPSVTEELKESVHTDNKERKESMSSETHVHSASKKYSTTKKRASSPDTIALAPMQTDAKRSIIAPSQPIPAQVSPVTSAAPDQTTDKYVAERREDDNDEDSITGEIAELQTPEVIKKSSEWVDSSGDSKKGVSWNDAEYTEKVQLEGDTSKSQPNILERKTSIGPCYRSTAPFGKPSGITISLSKKSTSAVCEQYNQNTSVINITLSKKCFINKTITRTERQEKAEIKDPTENRQDVPKQHFFGALRYRLTNMSDRIRNIFV